MSVTTFHFFQKIGLPASVILLATWTSVALGAAPAEIQEWLRKHNEYRALHGVPAVVWSDTVAAGAQAYADTCPQGHSGSVYGENLAWASYDLRPAGVVKLWYDEEPLYDYDNPGFSSQTGHFTQVVWKGTTEIGCGYATNCNYYGMNYVWVCQYNPHGNIIGQFAENVFPPGTTDPQPSPSPPGPKDSLISSMLLLLK